MKNVNSWKNEEVFKDQLALNEAELNNYPMHWLYFLEAVRGISGDSVRLLDIGCGCGAYKELCAKELPNVSYTGLDYSEEAINIAKERWGGQDWIVADYQSLTEEDASKYDVVHAGALLDVLPYGDEALKFLLGLGFDNVIIGRAKLTPEASHYKEYTAYDKIETYAYSHNVTKVLNMLREFPYTYEFKGHQQNCTIVLKRIKSPKDHD